ncbi:hypothetical protein OY671_008629, partial [Metschnikowia pulcherrima]
HRALPRQPARAQRPVLPGQQPLCAEGLQGRHRAAERHGAEGPRQRPRPRRPAGHRRQPDRDEQPRRRQDHAAAHPACNCCSNGGSRLRGRRLSAHPAPPRRAHRPAAGGDLHWAAARFHARPFGTGSGRAVAHAERAGVGRSDAARHRSGHPAALRPDGRAGRHGAGPEAGGSDRHAGGSARVHAAVSAGDDPAGPGAGAFRRPGQPAAGAWPEGGGRGGDRTGGVGHGPLASSGRAACRVGHRR